MDSGSTPGMTKYMARSLNKVELIGNLTRDTDMRYTPQGTAVCTFGLATNRQWTTDSGEKKEDVEFHRIVAWNKLAEICGQLLSKGKKVYVEGRLQTRKWTGQDGVEKQTTEIVINDMIILSSTQGGGGDFDIPDEALSDPSLGDHSEQSAPTGGSTKSQNTKKKEVEDSQVSGDDDIPF